MHLDRPRALELAGEQLAADGVTHVVAQQREPVDAERLREGDDDVGLFGERVPLVGLGRQAVAEEVEQQHPARAAQVVEHRGEVVRRAREAVQDEQRLVDLRLERGRDDGEDRVPGEVTPFAGRLPFRRVRPFRRAIRAFRTRSRASARA